MPILPSTRKIRFDIRPWRASYPSEMVPYIDNVSLVDLISGFEHAAGYDVPGQYAGLVLDNFNFGDLEAYLTGQSDDPYWVKLGAIAVLSCDCGELGCWPLYSRVIVDDDTVTWRGFEQPYRRDRDYGTFGPFVFRRNQYEGAARAAAAVASEAGL